MTGSHLVQIDVRSGARRNALDLRDSVLESVEALPGGWAWIPASVDRIVVYRSGHTREFMRPSWYAFIDEIEADPSGQHVFFLGQDKSQDTVRVDRLTLSDWSASTWMTAPGDFATLVPFADGTALVTLSRTTDTYTFVKLLGPGQSRAVGTSPRQLYSVTVSRDMKRAAAVERDYRADAWMSKVIRQEAALAPGGFPPAVRYTEV